MSENSRPQQQSFFSKYKWYIIGILVFLGIRGFMDGNESNTSNNVEYVESETIEPTEGVVTSVKEVQSEIFKITDEAVVPKVEDSRIVASYMDGGIDTFTLDEIALVDTTIVSEDSDYRRRSGISRMVTYGLIGYYMGRRPYGAPIRQSSYANRESYQKSQAGRSRVTSTATRRTVRTPRPSSTGKSGYGSGKSTKSYGG